ncbi:hypothetical protein AGMMS4952_13440 [Spirochaetia bacterium]|nr:hypothetical protein AGMMS4952_13440 [Spirochaetia bacterium]
MAGRRYLKWNNDTIGTIDDDWNLTFTVPRYNRVVALYAQAGTFWPSSQFYRFLEERLVSKDRRDIEKILFRLGLPAYDVFRITEITRAIHPKDLLWIASTENETLNTVITTVFDSVFHQKIDLNGDSLDSPEGQNIKRYGVFKGHYGIYKQRLNPLSTDTESEIAVFLLAQKLGVSCCPAYFTDRDTIFSEFLFDFSREYIVHFRHLFNGARSDNEYKNLITVRPQYKNSIIKMMILDFITRQDDRHLSNIAVKISGKTETFYPLYDNGRSLFYEDTEETVQKAVRDIENFTTVFGYAGTYWDHLRGIAGEEGGLAALADITLTRDEAAGILWEACFTGYRFEGALEWITGTTEMVRGLR